MVRKARVDPVMRHELDIPGLCRAMSQSRLMLRYFRQERVRTVRQYVGLHYSEQGTDAKVPINLLSLYVQIVGSSLVAQHPRMMLSTFNHDAKPVVRSMQDWINRQIKYINLKDDLKRCVIDSLFSLGIGKVGLANVSDAATYAWNLKAGEPFFARVDLDDFVYDSHARDFQEADFIGHRIRVPFETVADNPHYNRNRRHLSPVDDAPYNVEGDERISMINRTYVGGITQEFEKKIDIWEVYLPKHRLVLTLPDDYLSGPYSYNEQVLSSQRWIGPAKGPYSFLGHYVVPGNAMPKAPIQDLVDIHEATNQTLRKIMRSIERIKDIAAAPGGAMEDAARVLNANDGDVIQCNNPDLIKQFVVGGNAIQSLVAVFTQFKEIFSYGAGNLDIAGGLGPQSKTATQDKMLSENASHVIQGLQEATIGFVQEVGANLCWYWHHDPINNRQVPYKLQGVKGITTMRNVSPQERQRIPWEMLEMEVDPYSLAPQTPQTRLAALNQTFTQIILPAMQLMAQQGIVPDFNSYLEKIGAYTNDPDLAEILTIREVPGGQAQSPPDGGGGAPSPAETTRNYVRESRSAQTQQGTAANSVASLLGHNMGGSRNGNGVRQPA